MVSLSDSGQLFTIEGLTAALIMIASAYLVLGTGMVFTPGDAHISDMQLQQLGNDALLMMDTKDTSDGENRLVSIVYNASPDRPTKNEAARSEFDLAFTDYLRKNTGSTAQVDSLRYSSAIYSVSGGDVIPTEFANNGDNFGRNPAVRCGRYVSTNWDGADTVERLEVLIWRD